MKIAVLLLLGGCLNVPAFDGDRDGGTGDGAPDAPLSANATVSVVSRDGTQTPRVGQTVFVEYDGDPASGVMTATGADGTAQITAGANSRVYVYDMLESLPTLVVIDGVAAGDTLHIGTPYEPQNASQPLVAQPLAQALFSGGTPTSVSINLPCGHSRVTYAPGGSGTVMVEPTCGNDAMATPALLYYETASGSAVGVETGTWTPGPDSTLITLNPDATNVPLLFVEATTPDPAGITAAPSYVWAFANGRRIASVAYSFDLSADDAVPWKGIDDEIEFSEWLNTGGELIGMLLRDRGPTPPPSTPTEISTETIDLAPWLESGGFGVAAPNTLSWTLAQPRTGYGATQLVVLDVYDTSAMHAIRWIAPASAVQKIDDLHEMLAMPIPEDIFPGFAFDTMTQGAATVRLVHAQSSSTLDDAATYDALRPTADIDAAFDDFADPDGITRAAISGVSYDVDATRHSP